MSLPPAGRRGLYLRIDRSGKTTRAVIIDETDATGGGCGETALPVTEQENPRTAGIDRLSTLELVRVINDEDKSVALAVERILPEVARAIDGIVARLHSGGRLFYVGTGTSGRLGVLDASECPPTYGVSPERVQGVIAGGYCALHSSVENAEDDAQTGAADLRGRGVNRGDAVVGITASGRTPYTAGALEWAQSIGCFAVALTCVPESAITRVADVAIVPVVGPEVIAGSSRMKAGTAQKLVLNMLSSAAMIRLGLVRGNRMTNLMPRNHKLRERSLRILVAESGLDEGGARRLLLEAGGELRKALVMHRADVNHEAAMKALEAAGGSIEGAVQVLVPRRPVASIRRLAAVD
jgi:N-acetylmuramic acid 6-phosphate etherase